VVGLCEVSALSAHPMLFVAVRSLFYLYYRSALTVPRDDNC
jgi:hypothetical protein